MRPRSEQEEIMVQYLLGRLSPEEESQIEEQFFTDDLFFEQLLAAEDTLIDDYIEDALSADERKMFEESLLFSNQQMDEVTFTRNLINNILQMRVAKAKKSEPKNTRFFSWMRPFPSELSIRFLWHRYSFISFLLLAFICVYLLISSANMRARIHQLEYERAALESNQRELQQIISQNKNTSPPVSLSDIASLVLSSAIISRGGGEIPTVEMPSSKRQLQIQVELEDKTNYSSYIVAIETVRGRNVWMGQVTASQKAAPDKLSLLVPAEKFESEVYILKVKGQAEGNKTIDVGEYPFRVKR